MSDATIARPYARAVFEYARECDELGAFSTMLELGRALVLEERLAVLLKDPRLSHARRAEMLIAVGAEHFNDAMQQFLRILGEQDRLLHLPAIAEQFEQHRAEKEQRLNAEVISAYELDETQQERIRNELAERTGRTVDLVSHIDEQLLGGVIVRAGDRVLDGSLRGRLQHLAQSLA